MVTSPLFVRLSPEARPAAPAGTVTVTFNGSPMNLPADTSLAAGLLAAGVAHFRNSAVSGSARAPYCMMGVCYECLVEIDGMPSQQACLVRPREGMQVRTMDTLPGELFTDAGAAAPAGASGRNDGGRQ